MRNSALQGGRHAILASEEEVEQADDQIGFGNHAITVDRTPTLPGAHRSLGATAMPAKEREWKNTTNAIAGRTVALVRTTRCCCGKQRSVRGR